ncbi:Pyoverdine/dityrosine biosynthesis protein-domain-containing protein [Coniella lustricola]|uniref:Pyoverdine/dityrosine biosynthesis protein-domain-containing protein n=1 Tax=Coniella lustricola TaxID=2025994 RepID=A0A2T3A0S9_9PEZI|nr:Pyoverdine/dityrosine biosynthesis protein-domain-containing protein [Coniella lustricola]
MEARIFALEGQLHQLGQQQLSLASLLGRLLPLLPSLDPETRNVLGSLKSLAHFGYAAAEPQVIQDEKAQSTMAVQQLGLLTPPTTPLPEDPSTPKTRILDSSLVVEHDQLASDILDIIKSYSQHLAAPADDKVTAAEPGKWLGKHLFMDKVKVQLKQQQAIRLILPAFPWKSVNKVDKVTGALPDLGEELALYRLNQLCEDIKSVYPLGGEVYIATDGLLFDDVVGISDAETWHYGEGLVQMAREHNLSNIRLMRVMDILNMTTDKVLDQELYLSLAGKCRETILSSYGRTEEEVRQMMKDDPDTLTTYRGFITFLEQDLRFSPVTAASKAISGSQYRKTVKKVAIQMMVRAESFTKLLQDRCTDYVRLSIHPSTGAVKLSIPLVVQGSGAFPRSPWHSSVALAVDGTYRTVPAREVRETHDLILRDGRPYYFREKSDLWQLSSGGAGEAEAGQLDNENSEQNVMLEPCYPNRLVVTPAKPERQGIQKLSERQIEKLRLLRAAHTAGPVEVVGFANME